MAVPKAIVPPKGSAGSKLVCVTVPVKLKVTGAAFDLIREAAARHPAILIRMADVLRELEPMLDDEQRRDEVGRELGKLAETARQGSLAATDLKDVIARIETAREAVGRLRLQASYEEASPGTTQRRAHGVMT